MWFMLVSPIWDFLLGDFLGRRMSGCPFKTLRKCSLLGENRWPQYHPNEVCWVLWLPLILRESPMLFPCYCRTWVSRIEGSQIFHVTPLAQIWKASLSDFGELVTWIAHSMFVWSLAQGLKIHSLKSQPPIKSNHIKPSSQNFINTH